MTAELVSSANSGIGWGGGGGCGTVEGGLEVSQPNWGLFCPNTIQRIAFLIVIFKS